MPAPHADRILHNGDVLTMGPANTIAEAVAIRDGRIAAVGRRDDVIALAGPATEVTDLRGLALLPGFIDPHSHIGSVGDKLASANLSPVPIGPISTMADLKRELRDHIERNNIPPGDWVVGMGYDDTAIAELRHPDRDDLDDVSRDHPIYLTHISFHLGALNSLGLERLGISAATADPAGGRIRRRPNTTEPNGVLEELALSFVLARGPKPDPDESGRRIVTALKHYASLGVTTAQEAAASDPAFLETCARLAAEGALPIDLVVYPIYPVARALAAQGVTPDRGRFRPQGRPSGRFAGVKLLTDGSIQGYTAYLSHPYHVQPPDKDPTYRGYSWFDDPALLHPIVARCYADGWPIIAHANGDAAIQMVIDAARAAAKAHPGGDRRTTIIHAQTIREDQLDEAKELGLVLSFFPAHIYYWGDRHRDVFLGPERAARLNPLRAAVDRGITITLHHDAPVTPPDMLTVVWAAVNRVTSSGQPLGPDQRLTVTEALRAVTINAAYQIFEDADKGSIEPGKLADLVVLAANPLTVDPTTIRDLAVIETIKEGVTVHRKPG